MDSHDEGEPVHDDAGQGAARWRQIALLRELAGRLEAGEPPLPTDVFAVVARESELRHDDDAIEQAYVEQGARKGEPWVFCRGRVLG